MIYQGDKANGSGTQGENEEQMGPGDTDGPGGQGGAVAMSVWGRYSVAEGWGGAGGTEDRGGARGKMEPYRLLEHDWLSPFLHWHWLMHRGMLEFSVCGGLWCLAVLCVQSGYRCEVGLNDGDGVLFRFPLCKRGPIQSQSNFNVLCQGPIGMPSWYQQPYLIPDPRPHLKLSTRVARWLMLINSSS